MSINIQINLKNSNNVYEILYPETIASQITSGTLSNNRIPSLDTSKLTSGTLGVNRGGTGVTSYSALKSAMGLYNAYIDYELIEYVGDGSNTRTFTSKFHKNDILVNLYSFVLVGVYINESIYDQPEKFTVNGFTGTLLAIIINDVAVFIGLTNDTKNTYGAHSYYDFGKNNSVFLRTGSYNIMLLDDSKINFGVLNKNGVRYSWRLNYLLKG